MMNHVNNYPAIDIDGYNLSILTEVTTATTMNEDYQHQLNVSPIDTTTKTATTTDHDLLTTSPNPNNNNTSPRKHYKKRKKRKKIDGCE